MPVNTKLYKSTVPLKNDTTTVYNPEKVQAVLLNTPIKKDLFTENKTQYVDSVLTANKDKEWVKRLVEPQKKANSIKDPFEPQYRSTHLMADDGNGYVYPTVIMQNNKLIHYPTTLKLNEEEAIDYAKKNNLGIQLPKDKGTWFANNGYKLGTNVNNDIDPITGIPFHDPNYKLQK